MSQDTRITLDIWSDYVCPFCYLELPAVTRVQQAFGPRLDVVWHAFELRPDPVPTLDPDGEYLHTVWNRSVYPMAQRLGMQIKLPPVQPRSRKAFEAVAFARDAGHFDAMHLALFRGFFEQGRDIGDSAELLSLATQSGLDGDALQAALDDGRYTQQVLQDERRAQALGITGVPLLLVRTAGAPWETAVPLQGAVPYDHLHATVQDVAQRAEHRG
jgi:predicted DsbA family dithiol-disulfide isomerase